MKAQTMIAAGLVVSLSFFPQISAAQPQASQQLFLAYPPNQHQTSSAQLFFIGSADPNVPVTLNGDPVARSPQGNFAPILPLSIGKNIVVLQAGTQRLERTIIRVANVPTLPTGGGFAGGSLLPRRPLSLPVKEPVCFGAIAPANADVTVSLAGQTFSLAPEGNLVQLPANNSLLYGENQPQMAAVDQYQGCRSFAQSGEGLLGTPQYRLEWRGKKIVADATGSVTLLDLDQPEVIAVTANPGVARTGPSTDYSRLTPLPQGTQASVTGRDGDWLRLDYGGWIRQAETETLSSRTPPHSFIRSVGYQRQSDRTEFRFPLQRPVPVSVQQHGDRLTLTLYNTTAQTDTIRVDANPILKAFSWQQSRPQQIDYHFQFHSTQQWGYDLRYEDTTLVLSLRHPPTLPTKRGDLSGIKILIDPGHGGKESGAVGPTGYAEKEINLLISLALAQQLQKRGAAVSLTRRTDQLVSLQDRVAMMEQVQPAIMLSIHYNALPDSGDPNKIQGVSTFWYHPQSEALAQFLQQDLAQQLERESQGVFFNSLAVIRPAIAPAVLLELGYMINPTEFEWITNTQAQEALVETLTESLVDWFYGQPNVASNPTNPTK